MTRVRDLGHRVGRLTPGASNTVVDVQGVHVGHVTLDDGRTIFSGVTAVVVDGVSPRTPARAGVFVGNGYGKLIGSTQVQELGRFETPVVLTSTLSAFRAADAIVTWVLREHGSDVPSINPVVGEINDSWLSSVERRPVAAEHVIAAIDSASSDAVQMGNVGGGTGACALGFKGGIGSSSRVLTIGDSEVVVGALVQINMDGRLRTPDGPVDPRDWGLGTAGPESADGSCVVVVAVDAPLDAGTLRRMAARGVYALARVGTAFSHGSGDYGIALATPVAAAPRELGDRDTSLVFEATMDAVEEAVLDALLAATTVQSQDGRVAAALPIESLAPKSWPGRQ
jgi:D-aminopeptidase